MELKEWMFGVGCIALTACSSGGGNSHSVPNLSGKSLPEAMSIYQNIIADTYQGESSLANINKDSLLSFSNHILYDLIQPGDQNVMQSSGSNLGVPLVDGIDQIIGARAKVGHAVASNITPQIDYLRTESVDQTFPCDESGSVHVKGTVFYTPYGEENGVLNLSYNNCTDAGVTLNGSSADYYDDGDLYSFFSGTQIEVGNKSVEISGWIRDDYDVTTSNIVVKRQDTGEVYRLADWEIYTSYYGSTPYGVRGKIFHADYGYINVDTVSFLEFGGNSSYSFQGEVSLTGANDSVASITFLSQDNLLVAIDFEGDGSFDEMLSVSPERIALEGDQISDDFVNYVAPNYPPSYSYLEFVSDTVNTTDQITVEINGISDPENDSVEVSYVWSIDGVISVEHTDRVLPAYIGKKNQLVEVYAVLNDGHNQINSGAIELVVGDAPSSINASNLVEDIEVNESLEVSFVVSDPDESDGVDGRTDGLVLAYGPPGMTFDSGQLNWNVSESSFGKVQRYHFGVRDTATDEVMDLSVKVTDMNAVPVIARSGFVLPDRNHSISVGDFDNDDRNEIILTGAGDVVYTVEKSGDGYVQDWMYPYGLSGNIVQLISHDIDDEPAPEIIALTSNALYVIEDTTSEAKQIVYSEQKNYLSVAVMEVEGTIRLVLADEHGVDIFQLDGTLTRQINLSDELDYVLVGNVDDDSAQEIILSSGHVYDGETYQNEWFFPQGFGENITLIDIDSNGIDEIAGVTRWEDVEVFSATSKTKLFTILVDRDLCSISAGNLDADSNEELITGDCQHGNVTAYDLTLSGSSQKWQSSSVQSGVRSVMAGDADSDGLIEVVWAGGLNSSAPDVLVVADIENNVVANKWNNSQPEQLENYVAAGVANITPSEKKAIFVIPSADGSNGYDGQYIAEMDFEGIVSLSDPLSRTYTGGDQAEVVDFNNDGYDEIYLASSEVHSEYFQVLQLSDLSEKWSSNPDSRPSINGVFYGDLNDDGFQDAIYTDGSQIIAIDILDQTLIWTSSPFSSIVLSVAVADLSGSSLPELVISTGTQVSVWTRNGVNDAYTQVSSANQGCTKLAVGQLDGGETIVCMEAASSYYSSSETEFIKYDYELNELDRFTIVENVRDFVIPETQNANGNLLISTSYGYSGYYSSGWSYIRMISANKGEIIWSSPSLVGRVNANSLYYDEDGGDKLITFATSRAMYLVQ